jgi:hypothetical protein
VPHPMRAVQAKSDRHTEQLVHYPDPTANDRLGHANNSSAKRSTRSQMVEIVSNILISVSPVEKLTTESTLYTQPPAESQRSSSKQEEETRNQNNCTNSEVTKRPHRTDIHTTPHLAHPHPAHPQSQVLTSAQHSIHSPGAPKPSETPEKRFKGYAIQRHQRRYPRRGKGIPRRLPRA